MYPILLIHPLVNEHLDGFRVLPIVNTAMTTGVQTSLQDTVVMKQHRSSSKCKWQLILSCRWTLSTLNSTDTSWPFVRTTCHTEVSQGCTMASAVR